MTEATDLKHRVQDFPKSICLFLSPPWRGNKRLSRNLRAGLSYGSCLLKGGTSCAL